jgi:hypothetical protein
VESKFHRDTRAKMKVIINQGRSQWGNCTLEDYTWKVMTLLRHFIFFIVVVGGGTLWHL